MGKCPLLKRSTTTKTSTHIHVRLVRENSSDSLVMRIFSAYMIMYTMHTMQQQNVVCLVFGWDANASTWIECIRRIRTEKNEFYSPNSLAWFELHHKTSRSMLVRDHHNIKRTFVYACIKIRFASSHMWWLFSASVFLSDYERQRRLRCKQITNFETLSSIWTLKIHIIIHGYCMPNRHHVYWYNAGKINCTYSTWRTIILYDSKLKFIYYIHCYEKRFHIILRKHY